MVISHLRSRQLGGPRGIDEACRRHLETLSELGVAALVTYPGGSIAAWNDRAARLWSASGALSVARPLWSADRRRSVLVHESAAREMVASVRDTGRWSGEALLALGAVTARARLTATRVGAAGERPTRLLIAVMELLDGAGLDDDAPAVRPRSAGEGWHPILDSLVARLALLDESGVIVAVNETWRRAAIESGSSTDYVGSNYLEVCDAASDPNSTRTSEALRRIALGEIDVFELVYPSEYPSGRQWFLLRAVPYVGRDGWIVVSHQDVTEAMCDRERAHQQASMLDQIDAAVYAIDLDRIVLSWNAGAERLFGWTAEEAIGRPTSELMRSGVGPLDRETWEAVLAGDWDGRMELTRKGGSTFPAYVRTSVATDLLGAPAAIVCVAIDVSEKLMARRALEAARDHLRAVTDSIGEGMFTLDLAGRVTYMNPAAEQALGWTLDEIGGRVIQELVRSGRLPAAAEAFAEGGSVNPELRNAGVVRIEDDVFRRADGTELPVAYTASPFATDQGIEGLVVVFQDITERRAEARRIGEEIEKIGWVRQIQNALADDHMVLFAQPIIDLRNDAVVQRELLIRMRDRDDPESVIGPGAFLPVAEEYGLIGDIDRWVIDQAVQLAAGGLAVELNVSAASIGDRRLIPHIESTIARHGADPRLLVFEITETAVVSNEHEGRHFVERMHQLGCKVALDDFGTGYGGFTYLKKLPIDYLKIDIEFVRDLVTNVASRNVVEAIVTLAARFDLKTVAEGVEDFDILKMLKQLGVDYAQGYHIGRPAPLEA